MVVFRHPGNFRCVDESPETEIQQHLRMYQKNTNVSIFALKLHQSSFFRSIPHLFLFGTWYAHLGCCGDYTFILLSGLFHNPWHKDPVIKQPGWSMESLQHPPSSGEYNSPYLHPGGSLHREGPSASRLLGTWEIHSVSQLQTLWNSPWFGSLGGGWKAWCGVVVLVVWHTNLRNGELFRVGEVCIFYPLVRFNNKKRGMEWGFGKTCW